MKKAVIILLSFVFLFCAVSCFKPSPEPNTGAATLQYDDIVEKYTELLTAKANGEVVGDPSASADEIAVALYGIVRDCADPSIMGYATKDINRDGSDELVLLDKSTKLFAIFTMKNGAPVLLLRTDHMSASITPDGTVYAREYIKDQSECIQIKKIADGELEGLEYGSIIDGESTTFYKIENGERTEITWNEKVQLNESIQNIMLNSRYYTKTAGFRFVPAVVNGSSDNQAPVPDFSSYDGILSAYKIIVESFSEYSQSDWTKGKFDRLFEISDNECYEIFHQIFYGGIRLKPTETYFGQDYAENGDHSYGYAKKDLNGDGIEELILLNDHYEIFAIFTMKDGKAVLIEDTFDLWIDEKGLLRRSVETGGLVGSDGEGFVYKIDGSELKILVGVGYKVNFYLEKEGWYKIEGDSKTEISKEEGEALYAEYNIRPSYYCEQEYTRTFSGVEFVPLFEATLASQKHLNTFSNAWFVNGDTLTVSAISDTGVTFTFENVCTASEVDPVTNPDHEVHITTLTGEAVRNGNRYSFEIDGVKGSIEFAVNSAWVIVTESENEHVACRAYLFDRPEN